MTTTTPATTATNHAVAPRPDPTLAAPVPLAAELGVPLGSSPAALVGYCNERGGKLARSVSSNRGFVHCQGLPPPMTEALAWYCGDGLTDDARLCRIVQTSEPASKNEAADGLAAWSQLLSAHHGPPTEQTADDTVWTIDRQRISLFSDHDKGTSDYVTSVIHEAVEVAGALSGQPEFPTGMAGFELGMTRDEAKRTCKRQRGLFVDVTQALGRGFVCGSLQGEPPLTFSGISGVYCDGRLCELSMDLTESSRRALLIMSARYGNAPPSAVDSPKCGAGAKRYTWRWSRDDELVGLVRLVDDCSPVVFYDNADGWKLRQF